MANVFLRIIFHLRKFPYMLRSRETFQFKQNNMTDAACFVVNISRAQRVFKIPLAFAITLKGINTLRGVIKRQKTIKIRSYESKGEKLS